MIVGVEGLRLGILNVSLRRHGRARCRGCDRRRVVFSLEAVGAYAILAESDRLCAVCSGIVPGDRPTSLDEVLAAADVAEFGAQFEALGHPNLVDEARASIALDGETQVVRPG